MAADPTPRIAIKVTSVDPWQSTAIGAMCSLLMTALERLPASNSMWMGRPWLRAWSLMRWAMRPSGRRPPCNLVIATLMPIRCGIRATRM